MKATLHDEAMLAAVTDEQLTAYLKDHGWKPVACTGDIFTVWGHADQEGGVRIPQKRGWADDLQVTASALAAIAKAERRTSFEVYEDVAGPVTAALEASVARLERALRDAACLLAGARSCPPPAYNEDEALLPCGNRYGEDCPYGGGKRAHWRQRGGCWEIALLADESASLCEDPAALAAEEEVPE